MMSHQPRNPSWGQIALWSLLGGILAPEGQRLQAAARFGATRLLFERPDILLEWQRQENRKLAVRALVERAHRPALAEVDQPEAISSSAAHRAARYEEQDAEWRRVIVPPAVVLLLGKRGSGKSALGYRLLELHRHALQPYVVGVPKQGDKLLPGWIGVANDLEDVPQKSIVLIDEAYLRYHSRYSQAAQSRAMSLMLNLSRQKDQTIVFVSQEARQIDRNVVSSANVVVVKDPGILQVQFDRPELNKLMLQTKKAFGAVCGDKRSWSYVYSPDADFEGLLRNDLPSFWKAELSRVFAYGEQQKALGRVPRRMSPHDKADRAKQLRAQGASYGAIARILGVTRGTALNYVRDYPYGKKPPVPANTVTKGTPSGIRTSPTVN